MKHVSQILITLVALIAIAGCGPKVVEDIVAAYPENAKLVFENDYVRAVEFTLQPGDKLPLHPGGNRAVYALSDYKIKWTEGAETTEMEWQAGDVHWHEAIQHAVENIGTTEARYLVVTRTETALPETGDYDAAHDASQVDTEHSTLVFENDWLRVIAVTLEPGESQPKHDGINRLIYTLSEYTIEYSYYQLNSVEAEMQESFIHWHAPDEHSVKNVGDTTAQYLIFAFYK